MFSVINTSIFMERPVTAPNKATARRKPATGAAAKLCAGKYIRDSKQILANAHLPCIVKQSGGYISVYSAPEKGTTFKIYLPRVESPVEVGERDQTSTAELKGSETILLAEDDLSVKTTSVRILKNCGYRVLTASDGEEALRIAEQFKEPIHLLLTDVIMPKMDGLQLAQRIAALRPKIKIVFMSGYTTEALVQREIIEKNVPFISKPFEPQALAREVRRTLDVV